MNIDKYENRAWARFFRVLAVFCFLVFGLTAITGKANSRDLVWFFSLSVVSLIHFLFAAWCVETLADIRHYARETAIALTSGKEGKAEDTKPNASQEQ